MESTEKVRHSEDRVFVRRIYIENFKSIKHLELELSPGVNVLVGPNASGKTNILEALDFLRKALIDHAGRIPYAPHIPKYWSGKDLMYSRDPSKTIVLGLTLEHYHIAKGEEYITCRQTVDFKAYFRYSPQLDTLVPFRYRVEIEPEITVVDVSLNRIRVETMIDVIEKLLYEKMTNLLVGIEVESQGLLKEFESKYVKSGDHYIYEAEVKFSEPLLFFHLFPSPFTMCTFERPEVVCITVAPTPSQRQPTLIPVVSGYCEEYGKKPIVLGFRVEDEETFPTLFELPREALRRVIFIRHPDIGALAEPKPYQGELRLDERATNLASVLLALQGVRGGVPEDISDALAKLFPGLSIRIRSHMGRVALMAEENGLELPPPNIPDGAIKLLAIMTAVELKPSILLIDEIENSMHAKMLEYIVDRLNSLGIPVIVATHSPIVVDLLEPHRILIVFRDSEHGTYVERIEEPEKLYEELKRLGIALSDYVFYRLTYKES
ncbi:SMC domain protein [Ignisphaera aggregans DSM 17230]|uniref:SMC domain protein n=1 Tax=Ignisphaera aggregans (strain DSM 17230 / JCM 13409 / AQ1.S1) TaxID=583356 RepID=E0STK4_IGNAA|nr:SMC domain protein [Ignisphaera aggregans DSM 17230]